MKKELVSSLLLTVCCIVLFCVAYPVLVWGIAQLAPNKGEGFVTEANGKKYYENIGQKFTADKYFWSRPSAVDYNAAGSGGSNKAPSNPDYLKQVQDRIDTFVAHNPGVDKSSIPSELVTASGSGLDPDISVAGALVQAHRIAKARSMNEGRILTIIQQDAEKPFFGIAPQKINVLKLNLDLDKLNK